SLEEISVAALRKEQLPHPALRATLSRQAGEGKNMGASRQMSGEDLEQTLLRYAMLYNELLPQSALNSKTPMDAMNIWYASPPQIFLHPPGSNRPGCDSPSVPALPFP
ncbi:MAG: hypothetical protein LBO00_03290, partial [Zoogloeaceae bacterium]|nr:hypothetical protein [Zoogloeaceae bacterium]